MMAGSDGGTPAVAGGLARHIPVLVHPVVAFLAPHDGGIYVDATFGAGGYTGAILAAADTRVLAIDRDAGAVARGADRVRAAGGRLTLVQERFSNLEQVVQAHGHAQVDGVVCDLGVSSMQIDEAERGFSFRHDGPLDMRMGNTGPTAADLIAAASERDLAFIIKSLGEERHARAIARAIVAARGVAPIRTTLELVAVIERVVWPRPGAIHPATRTFQALRIFLNEELDELAAALAAAEAVLKPGGRLAVVSFHSLEDRIVKTFLVERGRQAGSSRHLPETVRPAPTFRLLTGRPVTPEESEIAANPRARSAKLRAAERTPAALAPGRSDQQGARLPSLDDVLRGRSR
ncbi:MAG TPA: 16S rRNA (cytosine(1402)-N(4))-methyltransferase RsmH [Xanthobacteraceae bacterium]|jgi:16S rRNA (cytosine1402-N4)-methyltransferase